MPAIDLGYALRVLLRSKLSTITIVLTVALGVGATAAVYSVVHAVLVRPLPFRDPARLVWVAERNDKLSLPTFTTSALNFRSWLEDPGPVGTLGAIGYATCNWSGNGEPEVLNGGTLTASVFPALGILPIAGRSFTAAEEASGAPPVVMISESLWRRRFGADPRAIGRRLDLDGTERTLVGVAPAALNVVSQGDVWLPLVVDPAKEKRLSHTLTVVGHLRPGVSLENAQAGMDLVAKRVGAQYPEVVDWGIRLVPFSEWIVPAPVRKALIILLVSVLCVMLIAAANIANLLLARALSREREVAVRAALGANRWRILAQLLTECVLLASAGGTLGVLAAFATVRWAAASLPPNLLPVQDIGMDRGVLGFAVLVTLACGLLFGLVPAWQLAGSPLAGTLRAGARGAVGERRPWLRRALVTAEVTLATALLVVAGLLVQSARLLGHVELGFEPGHVLTFQLNLPAAKDRDDLRPFAFYRELVPALASIPGVESVAVTSGLPMGAGNYSATAMKPVGAAVDKAKDGLTVDWRAVSPDYFRTMRIPLLRGRSFTLADDKNAEPTMVISKGLAETFWGSDDVVGNRIERVDGKLFTVVGVVGDTRLNTLGTIAPSLYYSSAWRLWPLMDVAVRTQGRPEAIVAAVRARVRSLDPALPLANVRPLESWVAANGAQPRLSAGLLTSLAALALLIAALGIYGVLAQAVAQRNSEIGVRMALGASRPEIVLLFLREGMTIGGAGIVLGLLAALAAGRILNDLVFGVSPHDVTTVAIVTGGLALVTALASFLPARRASRVDPIVSMRVA